MNRRKFLKISTITAGVTIIGGGTIYTMFKDSDPLSPFFEATQKVFLARFGDDISATLIMEKKQAYEDLCPKIPFTGGKENMFTEWLNYGAYYLAMYQALSARGHNIDSAHRAEQLSRYMCLRDYVISKAFNRGLVRYNTIAEGAGKCDFQYKKGRETFCTH